jgi:predicted SprT family Zn-dependent metalloprotease
VTPQQQEIVARCKECFVIAKQHWPHLNFDHVGIRFDLRGRAAGMASRRGSQYFMRFNADMLTREAFDHVKNDTVPHEIGHIVCFMDPRLGRNHDSGWARCTRLLGGSADRTHSEEVVYGKGLTYEYTTTRGHTVRVSQQIHAKVLRGVTYTYKHGKGAINKDCAHQVVGANGRTLAAPVRKVEAKVPGETTVSPFRITQVTDLRMPVVPAAAPAPAVQPVARAVVQTPVTAAFNAGQSKASIARAIMLSGHRAGHSHATIIAAIALANNWSTSQAKGTFEFNAAKVGIQL